MWMGEERSVRVGSREHVEMADEVRGGRREGRSPIRIKLWECEECGWVQEAPGNMRCPECNIPLSEYDEPMRGRAVE